MDAVAFIDPAVINFLNEKLVPIRLQCADPVLGSKFNIKWPPTLLVLDADGTEHYRTIGFYPPQDLIPSLLLGMGKAKFNKGDHLAAIGHFSQLLSDFPKNSFAPEALFLNGVCTFLETPELKNVTDIYDRMASEYPNSPWLSRAEPYKFLKG